MKSLPLNTARYAANFEIEKTDEKWQILDDARLRYVTAEEISTEPVLPLDDE